MTPCEAEFLRLAAALNAMCRALERLRANIELLAMVYENRKKGN